MKARDQHKKSVLFICLGNICRSPAAEGVFRKLVADANLDRVIHVDSAGTGGWHEGEPPDARMISHAKERGYDLSALEARQIRTPEDFYDHDYILTMDESNLRKVQALDIKKEHGHKIRPLVSYCKIHSVKEVPDPYYREADGFEHVLDLIEDACGELLEAIKKELK
jgi:protein-tyrosine phosphatase